MIFVISGGFDPIHEGHISYIRAARYIANQPLKVILNSDEWLTNKKRKFFQSFKTREVILRNIKGVGEVLSCDDSDGTVIKGLLKLLDDYPNEEVVFCKGGDRVEGNVPEDVITNPRFIIKYNVGGSKENSSSEILKRWESA